MSRAGRNELLPLTSVRGIAAWWVVLFHLRGLLAPWLPAQAIDWLGDGNLAVDLFFLLSGFVIYLNYGDRVRDWPSARDFLFRRFARIYPLHLLMLGGFLAYACAAILFGASTLGEQDPLYFVASLILVQNWGFLHALKWNVPAWSISTEAFAYLLFPALLALAPARRPSWLLAAAAILLCLAVPLYFALFHYPFPDAVPETGLVRCLAQFATGALLCELYLRFAGRTRLALPLLGTALLLATAYFAAGLPTISLAWAVLIMALALSAGWPLLSARPLVWLGRVSYATYLCHYLLLTLFKYAFVDRGQPTPLPLLALYLGLVLAASALLYHGFELPAQRGLLAWWKARRDRVQTLAAAE